MTSIRWANGTSGNWGTAADWLGGAVPGAGDSGTIDAAGAYTVALTGAQALQSLLLNDAGATVADTGTLALTGALTAASGTFALDAGGVVSGGTLSATGGHFAWNGGTLSGATYQGTLDLTASGASLTIANGLTAPAINASGAAASLTFTGTQAIDSMAITLGAAGGIGATALNFGDLTVGANATIDQRGGGTLYTQWSTDAGSSLTNNGTIEASQVNAGANINVTSLVNNGLISAAPGATLSFVAGSLTNNGTVSGVVAISTGTLTNNGVMTDGAGVSPALFINPGVFNDTGGLATSPGGWLNSGTFNLGSSTTQSYLALVGGAGAPVAGASLGTINLVGIGTQLRLLGSQSWQSGTINVGGTAQQITESALTPIVGATNTLILGSQTVMNHTAGSSTFNTGQLTLDGTINASVAGGLFTLNSGTLANNGAINVSGGDHLVVADPMSGTGKVTLASGGIAEFAASAANTDSAVFTDASSATLRLDLGTASAFKTPIQGFTDGNTIDLAGITATGATWSNGVLTIAGSGWGMTGPIALALPGNYAGATFHVANDGILVASPAFGFPIYTGSNITVTGAGSPPPPRVYGGTGANLTAAEGSAVTATLASFTDSNTADTASQLSAAITWGDGTTSTGVVSGAAGAFSVAAGHAYADEGSYPTSIAITNSADAVTTTLSGTVTATEADVLAVGAAPTIAATAGTAFSGTLASFTDSYAANPASDFTATIAWGDGSSSAGTVVASNGTISVSGAHTYAAAGTDPVSVTLADTNGTATATATGTATVGAAPTGGGTGVSVLSVSTDGLGPFGAWTPPNFNANTATAGIPGTATASSASSASYGGASVASSQTVSAGWVSAYSGTATFHDAWSATGTTSGAYNAEQSFGMQAGPGYANASFSVTMGTAGTFSIGWTATEAATGALTGGGSLAGLFGLLNMVAVIDGGTAMQVNPVNANAATPTGSFTGTLAAGTHTITIEDWSNYSGALGTFTGSLNETLTLAITPPGAPPPPPARTYGGSGTTLSTAEGTPLTAPVATFTDSNTTDAAANFSATIIWGDGTTSAGVITGANGSFSVAPAAGHVFADEGHFATSVAVLSGADGVTTTLSGAITATDADVLAVATAPAIAATAGQAYSATLATFTDGFGAATAADLAATIAWGDGTTSAGTVTATAGGFAVSGAHTWSAAGSDAVSVTLTDTDGTATATAALTATIAAASTGNHGWTLTKGVDTIDGGTGHDSILARAQTLSPGDHIDGGTGLSNSLTLVGGGAFNMTLPAVLDNISSISAVEGIGVAVPAITLRADLNANLKLTSSPNGAQATALVVGAANTATITLGNGSDTVYLGAGEKLITGTGNNTIHITKASASDSITAGTGTNTLVVDGGGSVTLGAKITGISTVSLSSATNLKLNAMGFITATGSAGTDTITAGAAHQTLTGGLGADTLVGNTAGYDSFTDTAAGLSGDLLRGFLATDRIDLTDIAYPTAHLTSAFSGANTSVTLTGGGASSTFLLQGHFSTAGFGLASDGHSGTVITHA